MKIKTVLVAVAAAGAGYVLGTRAGRAKFEQIKARADELAHSPQATQAAAKLADLAKQNADKLPDPLNKIVTDVADNVAPNS